MDLEQPDSVYPGMWRFPTNPVLCCIFRVPNSLRKVNPEAYTPQLVLIGPLHHSLKSQAFNSRGDITNTKYMGYLNMEAHKKIYLAAFAKRAEGENTIDGFRRIIEEEEDKIRDNYSESTAWIKSQEFVNMILHDSVFIAEFILRTSQRLENTYDRLMQEPCLKNTITEDLILLENQLPYFILKKLFEPIITNFRNEVISHFGFTHKIGNNSQFRHFTDLFRCVRVETLSGLDQEFIKPIGQLHNANRLKSGGVKFEGVENELSLDVKFENGCLKIPCFWISDNAEMILRNIMALEQCLYPSNAHVCSYIMFLDFLIDTEKDVEFLVGKGIIKNWIGHHGSIAEMVNKLGSGILDFGSYYSKTANEVNDYFSNPVNRSIAFLKRVYFSNMWTGTATIVATLLLLMTLIQTVASVIQVKQK